MLRGILPLFLALACSTVGAAQTTPVATSDNPQPDGTHNFTLTNTSQSPIVAFTIRFESPGTTGWKVSDPVINSQDVALNPGQTFAFHSPKAAKVELADAIFADGSSTGPQPDIQAQWDRRLWLSAGYREVVHLADNFVPDTSAQAPSPRDQFLQTLLQARETRMSADLRPEQRASLAEAYDSFLRTLQGTNEPLEAIANEFRAKTAALEQAIAAQKAPAGIRTELP